MDVSTIITIIVSSLFGLAIWNYKKLHTQMQNNDKRVNELEIKVAKLPEDFTKSMREIINDEVTNCFNKFLIDLYEKGQINPK